MGLLFPNNAATTVPIDAIATAFDATSSAGDAATAGGIGTNAPQKQACETEGAGPDKTGRASAQGTTPRRQRRQFDRFHSGGI
jgi:hypothetical protein